MVASPAVPLTRRRRLWAEFAALYIGAPLAIALFLPPRQMFTALILFSLAGLVLLWRTGGFEWRSLFRGWRRIPWGEVALIAVLTLVTGVAILWLTRPGALFGILRTRPEFMLVIWSLYPLLSALPQELIFRPLFFHRFGSLFPDMRVALLVNAAIFSFAHLMYWSVIVTILTFAGGLVFARAYVQRGFPAAWVLHAVAGNVIFAVGMGYYFYTGNVVRPF
ncbi:CPBP family glutamic-type intramembrane protease [Paracoccus sp. TK19116]|uniref:CPBP family glutamic-type intramembrane protease n=1 Tax=Paracoccus albicereus TaxID=2922394 RepID=A0ABT1MST0_9RHOB|nr:CPBP family glutamic-type intramembrane protease [Paracoccus albicereus]MCQ0971184.1 CPBP family glutamic-type intramembrane protease [Paracoccus albicereus]